MLYKTCKMSEAKSIISDIDMLDDIAFETLAKKWQNYEVPEESYDASYKEFRQELVNCFKTTLLENNGKTNYLVDLKVGIKLYELLNPASDFTTVMANNDDIWRYISVKVMPDITYLRYPDPAKEDIRLNKKRFYSHTRRIWLKSLWWYIHLSWQGNSDKTFEVLKNNTVDNINKLIETPGRGYRLDLFRAMMAEYSKTGPHIGKDFAAFTKMNNAKCVSIEPGLTQGGEKAYSKILFAEVLGKGKNANVD